MTPAPLEGVKFDSSCFHKNSQPKTSNLLLFSLLSLFSICLGIVVTNSSACFFGLSRREDFKFAKGNVLLSCLGEGAWVNHIPSSVFPASLMYLVTKLLFLKWYNLNFPLLR